MEEIQDFIEKYYPGYHHSDEIANYLDLSQLVEGVFDEDSMANDLLHNEYGGDLWEAYPAIHRDQRDLELDILHKAIKNFMANGV